MLRLNHGSQSKSENVKVCINCLVIQLLCPSIYFLLLIQFRVTIVLVLIPAAIGQVGVHGRQAVNLLTANRETERHSQIQQV